uniref:Odorant receptor n=1 Tax=Phlebotomus papatasi TaxID=29031 RepID=A0A3F2ZEA8_PHLPP
MVDYIECYPEYLEFERSVRFALNCLTLSFIPRNVLRGFEKFIFTFFSTYTVLTCLFSILNFEHNLMEYVLGVLILAGAFQLLIKTLSIAIHLDELNVLFSFIRKVHQVHKMDSITKSSNNHLKRMLRIIKIILKIMIPVWMISASALVYQAFYIGSVTLVVPGLIPEPDYDLNILLVHQFCIFIMATVMFLVVDIILVTIGFYFMAIFNIFRDRIKSLDNSGINDIKQYLINIHKFHVDILNKFQLFDEIFNYAFAVQVGTSVVFILLIFFLLRIVGFLFIPLFLATSGQFLFICLFGQLIFSKTEILFTELYLTKWYEFNVKEQKMLLLMMYRAQKHFGLRAAGMYDINLIMFIQVIKAGISFCAILYTFK